MAKLKNELPVRLFIGYDSRLPLGFHVFLQSVMQHSTVPISVTPLLLSNLQGIFTREKAPDQLTDFSYSRFIVPHLCDYKGWALFMDGTDMMLRDNISRLWDLRDDNYDVMVVKHPDIKGEHAFLNKTVSTYKMFNWSSLMLFNNAKCTKLSADYVNTASYHDLHQFKWLEHLDRLGELPQKWNHLVGYYPPSSDVSLVHWTQGAPHLEDITGDVEYEHEWHELKAKLVL